VIGQSVGGFRVVRELQKGGTGVIYLAEHQMLKHKAAVKALLPEFSKDPEEVNRFFNEAQLTAQIRHPGLIQIFDYGYDPDGRAYIVMELLEGEVLRDRITRCGRQSVEVLRGVTRQVAMALGAVHQHGIIHRDLKPENLFLVPDRDMVCGLRVKVLDFGIAKASVDLDEISLKTLHTRTGIVLGTPAYMSPEQCRGGQLDPRADVYALGCIMFDMACGRPPFQDAGNADMMTAHMSRPPPMPRSIEPSLPPSIEAIIVRALRKKADERYASMQELVADLDASDSRVPDPAEGPTHVVSSPPDVRASIDPAVPNASMVQAESAPSDTLTYRGAGVNKPGSQPPATATRASPPAPAQMPVPAPASTSAGGTRIIAALAAVVVMGVGVTYFHGRLPAATASAHSGEAQQRPAVIVSPAAPAPTAVAPAVPAVVPPTAVAPAVPAVVPPTAVAPAVPAVVPPPEAAPPEMVELMITTEPAGAGVFRLADGSRVGKTPLRKTVPRQEGQVTFVLRLSGYQESKVTLSTAENESATVPLKRALRRRPGDNDPVDPF
jgi:serine/threonine-protein kinase